MKTIVEDAILKYSADGIGVPDFALESAGEVLTFGFLSLILRKGKKSNSQKFLLYINNFK